jgi:hypothetical protein
VHKQRIKLICDFLFVGKVEGAFPMSVDGKAGRTRNIPNALQMHGANFDNMTSFFAFEDAIPTTSGHASHIE